MSSRSGLEALGAQWGLSPAQCGQLGALLDVLAGDPTAPTSVPANAVVDVHVADSLSALVLERMRTARAIADLGAGAGFPGAALAVALPASVVALVESNARKCAFMERMCDAAGVSNARIVHARAEEWPEGIGAHDVVVARAVAPLDVLCEYAAPLLAADGLLVAWKAVVPASEEDAGTRAAQALGLQPEGAVRVEPYPGSVGRHLHLYRKVAATPAGYPRRAGVARKRPLGG